MEGADLEQLVACALLQPLGEAGVMLGAVGLGETRVGDLADEHVLEAVGGLAGDRGARLVEHELSAQQVLERRVERVELGREAHQRALPERPADHGRPLQQRLRLRVEPVDARGDQRLQRVGDPADPGGAVLGQHPHRLLEEEGVALGLGEQQAPVVRSSARHRS